MSGVPDEIPVDVGVDSENLARRIQYRFDVNVEGGFSTTMTMESYDYGTADTVIPPVEGESGATADPKGSTPPWGLDP